ncbi:MAG TPA: HAD family phosphatase [Steroidobacteraceae bacterium]|jgi:HAD superfamily hydrolase (TIGR01509 family)|nr:HAD family phosphatase [Steroidobacteraceae bacterium]
MATLQLVRSIVFDIGWVLVRMDYRPLLGFLQAHGAQLADRDAVMTRIRLEDHETGQLPGHGLLERLRGLTRTQTVSLEETQAKWLDMFELEPAMIELAHRLSERHRVFLLSNIGDLHWAHLSREYRLHAIGHGALPSYVAGVMKPHPAIYAQAERRFALEPAATVFIDDRAANVATARARGWHGIVHQGYPDTLARLQTLGVSTC